MMGTARPLEPVRLVIDASVGIKLLVREDLSDRAEALFALLAAEAAAHYYVPDLFFVECANILWKYARRFGYPHDNALQDVAALAQLKLRSVSTADLIGPALRIGLKYGHSAYDASYLALAERLRLPLITADQRLVEAATNSPHNVQWLGSYEIPSPPT
jgi:predicted nucleic acid-binding protein